MEKILLIDIKGIETKKKWNIYTFFFRLRTAYKFSNFNTTK